MALIKHSKCPDCEAHPLKKAVHRNFYLYVEVCDFCGWTSQPTQIVGQCCENPDTHKVKMYIADGRTQVRLQCKNCGATSKESLSQKGLKVDDLPQIDLDARGKADALEVTHQNQLWKQIQAFKAKFKS